MANDSEQAPAMSADMAYNLMWIIFALTLAPCTFGSAVVYILGRHHVLSYWWLAGSLGWAIVPIAVLIFGFRIARRLAADTAAAPDRVPGAALHGG